VADPATIPPEVTVGVGERRSIALRRPSGGYGWSADVVAGDAGAVELALGYAPASATSPGSSADQELTITGVQVGRAELRLLLGRSWEPPDAAIGEHRLVVTVAPERNQAV
jgi:Chagasin family peptidase inhibitor I42